MMYTGGFGFGKKLKRFLELVSLPSMGAIWNRLPRSPSFMADSPLFFLCQSPFAKLLAKLVFFVDFFPAVHALLCSPGLEAEPSSRFWGGIGPEPLVESSSRLAYVEL
ncbi:hypothetical protein SDJN02_26916, partial [Cucurbita argyrosperma subsp. argyrosperma]